MAYDKIIPIRSRLDSCLWYAQNPSKTSMEVALNYFENAEKSAVGQTVFQTAINCRVETAFRDMQETKTRWGKVGGVQGYHLIHSYVPGEVAPEQAHRLGVEFASALLADRYEAVVSTHLDQNHLHCHIVFNSVSFVDGKKYQNSFKDYFGDIRGTSNEVSTRYGLSTITTKGNGKHYAEIAAEREGRPTIRSVIRKDIDAIIAQSFTYKTFLEQLRRCGYTIKYGENVRYTAIRPPGGSRFIRLNSLGDGYTEQEIRTRLTKNRLAPKKEKIVGKHFRVRGWKNRVQKPQGFRALYFHYVYLLSGRSGRSIQVTPTLLQEVSRLKQYQRQFRLLQTYRIDTEDQLFMLEDALQNEIDCLSTERAALYKERIKNAEVREDIKQFTDQIRQLRADLLTCRKVKETIPIIQSRHDALPGFVQPSMQREEEKHHERSR